MDDHILWMHGIECCKCWRPAAYHNFRTGLTTHPYPNSIVCRIHPPRQTEEPRR